MPTYEYRCPDGHEFEKFVQKISLASSELPCPVCGKMAERRISAGAGLVFKGSGFYITDYGKDGKKDLRANSAGASSADKPSSGASGEGSSSSEASTKGEGAAAAKQEGGKSESGKAESAKPDSVKPANKPAAKADAPAAPKSGSSDK
jgi:putative FmdB family regulatory protein